MLGSGAGSVLVPFNWRAFLKLCSRECEGEKERNVLR